MPIIVPLVPPSSATVTFDSLIFEASVHLAGCPNAVISNYYRKMAIELCDFAHVWRYPLDPIALIAGTYQYTLVSPLAHAEVISPLGDGEGFTDAGVKSLVKFATYDILKKRYSSWPDNSPGVPQAYTQYAPGSIMLAPVPEGTMTTLELTALLRPTATATVLDAGIANEFSRALFHGVVYEAMMMPGRPWSNEKLSAFHGKQWLHYRNLARTRALRGYNTTSLSVTMRPMA